MEGNRTEPAYDTAVVIRSKTRFQQLVERFNTKAQAEFYVTQNQTAFAASQGLQNPPLAKNAGAEVNQAQSSSGPRKKSASPRPTKTPSPQRTMNEFSAYEEEHRKIERAIQTVCDSVSPILRVKTLDRDFLPSYIFSPNDLVIVVGQDGLVANTAKYAKGNPIIGVNPLPDGYDGILLPFRAETALSGVTGVLSRTSRVIGVTMAEAVLNDGQRLLAFNDLFIGIRDHSSARYQITLAGKTENQSSSGIIVSTGAGSTGWLSSLFNMADGVGVFLGKEKLPARPRMPWDADRLVFVVREPFKSKSSGVSIAAGAIARGAELIVESLMPVQGVIFSDGIQRDSLEFNSGAIARIRIADERANLVCV